MADKYEKVVRWYLRFNGYLTVENFVIHEARDSHVPEGAEFDTLGVRFPYSREQVGQHLIPNDPRLDDPDVIANGLIDFVIAEVKSGDRNKLNSIWRPEDTEKKTERIAYLLKWIGSFRDDTQINEIAGMLQKSHRAVAGGYLIRLLYFSGRPTIQAVPAHVPQITFHEIAEFIVKLRTPCWKQYGLGVRSQHEQWDELIREIWDIGNPADLRSDTQKIESILELLAA